MERLSAGDRLGKPAATRPCEQSHVDGPCFTGVLNYTHYADSSRPMVAGACEASTRHKSVEKIGSEPPMFYKDRKD